MSHDSPKPLRPRTPKPHLKRLEDMTEPELSVHFKTIMQAVDDRQPDDVVGSMVITFMDNRICQYVASIAPDGAPDALRALADRLERRQTVTREETPS